MSLILLAAVAASAGPISIQIDNVRSNRGRVLVDICPKDRFLEDGCPYHVEVPARTGTTTVTIENVPPGEYAAQAFHDENANGEVDRALFGIPKEGVGFSRDARIQFGPPKWQDAAFGHQARPLAIRFGMRYMMGPKGPGKSLK